jgi:hypothetical protein
MMECVNPYHATAAGFAHILECRKEFSVLLAASVTGLLQLLVIHWD